MGLLGNLGSHHLPALSREHLNTYIPRSNLFLCRHAPNVCLLMPTYIFLRENNLVLFYMSVSYDMISSVFIFVLYLVRTIMYVPMTHIHTYVEMLSSLSDLEGTHFR
jgi:hypothetical protein